MKQELKIGRAGNGSKIHVVSVLYRDDGLVIPGIYCGAQPMNGSGFGSVRKISEFDMSKVTCLKCLNHHRGPK